VSPASTASLKVARRFRSVGERGKRRLLAFDGVRVERCACALERGLDRLRRRLEDRGGFVVGKPSTSRSTSAARCFAGSCCSATMNESWIASRCFVACFRSGSGIRKRAVRVRLEPAGLDGAAGS